MPIFCFMASFFAEGGGFEPPVRLPVRQFSKLLVSATHPSFRILAEYLVRIGHILILESITIQIGCKGTAFFWYDQIFWLFFEKKNYFCLWYFYKVRARARKISKLNNLFIKYCWTSCEFRIFFVFLHSQIYVQWLLLWRGGHSLVWYLFCCYLWAAWFRVIILNEVHEG